MKKKYRFILYFTILIIFAIWVGIWFLQTYYPATTPIERFFDITVPKEASEVQAQYNWIFQGGAFFLQFKLPSQNFDDLKLRLCGDQEFSTEYNREASRSWGEITPSWWLPDSTSISFSAECVIPGKVSSFDFFVDRSDANKFAIYMRGSYD